jgi:glycosyltransferase involved in cell wall biosynthesis
MVATHPDFMTKAGGTTVSRGKLISLFSNNNDVILLNPLGASVKSSDRGSIRNNVCRVYYFKQWSIFGKYASILTDLNIAFLLRIKDIVRREKIDLICITEPYGIISTSFICRDTPVVYDAHDIVSDHAKLFFQRLKMDFKLARLPLINKIVKWLLLIIMYLLERLACQRSKHIIAITEADKQGFMRKYHIDEAKITVIPVWMAVDDFSKIPSKQKQSIESCKTRIIFHGIYRHVANYEAFKLIEDYIAPEVKKCNPDIQFLLAGTDVPRFAKENIKSLGYVRDLAKLFQTCSMGIAPLLQGTGINIKVLDYMAAGLPIIATRQATKGIGLENGKHAIILDTVDENFINAILSLASDKQRRELLSKNALEFLKEKHNRQNIQNKLDKMLVKITAEVIK